MKNLGLGRKHSVDERDKAFPMKSLLLSSSDRKFKYWCPNMWTGNQGQTSQCVAYSWCHWLAAGPKTQPAARALRNGAPADPANIYHMAQQVDEWPGDNYDGTSVRAGAKVLKSHGYIDSYYWAWNVEEVINALLTLGPVVVGTNWTERMFYPSDEGIIKLTGRVAGGHAYLLDGISLTKGLIRIKNSWGREWGNKGFAYISIEDMNTLIQANGEACIATEINKEL
ncbi:MAG: hypothetical protein H5T96_09405 [Tissierellales bacterium]|nr:hypothetical protein [Tissierellales bacterium]